jgi:hypothetical protein
LSGTGASLIAHITDRDLAILKLLARYRYLPADDIHGFIGGSAKNLSHRLNVLSRKPNLYINRPHQQRLGADTNCRPLVYELDDKGIALLRDRGFPCAANKYRRNFAHELMACRIMASIELGTRRRPGIRLITWPEILASDAMPLAAKELPSPASIPVTTVIRGQRLSLTVTADARPFGLERTRSDGTRSYLFFPGIEADCGTEPIDASDADRTSIYKKFVTYRAIAEQGIYRSHFGFPSFFVPIITTSTARMESMMRLLQKMTGGRGSKMFLFNIFPAFTSIDGRAMSDGQMLTKPWLRAGFDPLVVSE